MTVRFWWGKHLAGPFLALIAIVLGVIAAFYAGDPSASGKIVRWSAWLTGLAAVLLIFMAQYDTWSEANAELGKEQAKNEAEPHIGINLIGAVSRGKVGAGITDLFVSLELILESPSQVLIQNFSLDMFDGAQSTTVIGEEDLSQWQYMRRIENGALNHERVQCVPLVKELNQRGNPVRGWIHFPIPNLEESYLRRCMLIIKINGLHGTCYYKRHGSETVGSDGSGFMLKISTS